MDDGCSYFIEDFPEFGWGDYYLAVELCANLSANLAIIKNLQQQQTIFGLAKQAYAKIDNVSVLHWFTNCMLIHLLYVDPLIVCWSTYCMLIHLLYVDPLVVCWSTYFMLIHLLYVDPLLVCWSTYCMLIHLLYVDPFISYLWDKSKVVM